MYKVNSVCSPEISTMSDDEVSSSPHAYVQYVDEQRAIVPISFIKLFPNSWRDKAGWDKNYLYKVFWSPDEDETPAKMLKKVAHIPVFDRDCVEFAKRGYYRAAVLLVAESKSDLESLIEKKRPSVGPLRLKHTSFDSDMKSNSKSIDFKPKADGAKKKKTGLNKDAQKQNTLDLRDSLPKTYSFLKHGTSSSGSLKRKSPEHSDTEDDNDVKPVIKGRPTRSRTVPQYFEQSSDSESGMEVGGDKIDPGFSPRKYAQLQEQLSLTEVNLKRAHESNAKLRGILSECQTENTTLQEQVACLQQELETAKKNSAKACKSLDFDSGILTSKSRDDASHPEQGKIHVKLQAAIPGCSSGSDKKKNETEISFDDNSFQDCSINSMCKVIATPQEPDTKSKAMEEDEGVNEESLAIESKESDYKPLEKPAEHQLVPGGDSIAPEVWNLIFGISTGPKRDLQFIKDLSLAAHGPEILAKSTILGTKRGGRKKSGEEKQSQAVKPGLDKRILKAVRDKLIERVQKDEGKEIEDPDDHPRTKLSFYHEAIRGAQKRVIQLGYGKGVKSNVVSTDILMSGQ